MYNTFQANLLESTHEKANFPIDVDFGNDVHRLR
jgi:hypothetical protein